MCEPGVVLADYRWIEIGIDAIGGLNQIAPVLEACR